MAGFDRGRASGPASLTASVTLDLNDDNEGQRPTHRWRPRSPPTGRDGSSTSTIVTLLDIHHNPLCLFDLGGGVNAELEVSFTVLGFEVLSFGQTFPLVDFAAMACGEEEDVSLPVLAHLDGSALRLTSDPTTSELEAAAGTNDPRGDQVDLLLVDKNGDLTDSVELLTTEGLASPWASVASGGHRRPRTPELGVQVGQQVEYEVFIVNQTQVVGALITDVTEDSFTLQAPLPNLGPPSVTIPYTIRSGKETLRVLKGGITEDFGPEETNPNRHIDDLDDLIRITTLGGGPLDGFGAGPDKVRVDPMIRLDVILDGGDGNDVLVGGSGLAPSRAAMATATSASPRRRSSTCCSDARGSRLEGGPGKDHLLGSTGHDVLVGGPGDDVMDGGGIVTSDGLALSGDDRIVGGGGDIMDGRDGDDVLIGDYDIEFDTPPEVDGQRREARRDDAPGRGTAQIFADNQGPTVSGAAHGRPDARHRALQRGQHPRRWRGERSHLRRPGRPDLARVGPRPADVQRSRPPGDHRRPYAHGGQFDTAHLCPSEPRQPVPRRDRRQHERFRHGAGRGGRRHLHAPPVQRRDRLRAQ
jgi:hypothetical protein